MPMFWVKILERASPLVFLSQQGPLLTRCPHHSPEVTVDPSSSSQCHRSAATTPRRVWPAELGQPDGAAVPAGQA